jgi:hypothetical protein
MLRASSVAFAALLTGCLGEVTEPYGQPGAGGGGGGTTPTGAGGGSGGGGGGPPGTGGGTTGTGGGTGGAGGSTSYDLPCAIAETLVTHCSACHGPVPTGGATFSLSSRADLTASSPIDAAMTIAQRAVIRMERPVAPMPPAPRPRVGAAELQAFSTWVTSGMPMGSCSQVDAGSADAGPPIDAGPQPTDCASGNFWTVGNDGSESMNPGMACRSCHLGQNFMGQNPGGDDETDRAYFFMGTVFAGLHAKDRCLSPPPAGGKIEIIDKNGAVAQTINVTNSSGNFRSNSLTTTVQLPYTVRISANGRTGMMLTPQTNGDCNSCHTEQGAQGAPGRIYWP